MTQLSFFEDSDMPVDKPDLDGVQVKTCKDCREVKPVETHFSFQVTSGKGKRFFCPRCKVCESKRAKITNAIRATAPPVTSHCECCGKDFATVVKKNIHMDHCEQSRTFRGWLCVSCNLGIGNLGDDIKGVEQALAYLRKHDERS